MLLICQPEPKWLLKHNTARCSKKIPNAKKFRNVEMVPFVSNDSEVRNHWLSAVVPKFRNSNEYFMYNAN